MKSEVIFRIPCNINLEVVVPSHLKGDARKRYLDRCAYLLHMLCQPQNKSILDKSFNEGYRYFMAKYLRNVLGTMYKQVVMCLEHKGIITVDHSWVIGYKSKGYSLTTQYKYQELTDYEIKSHTVTKQYRTIKKEYQKEQKKYSKKFPKCINQLSLPWQINEEACLDWISAFKQKLFVSLDKSTTIRKDTRDKIRNRYTEHYNHIEQTILNLKAKKAEYIIDTQAYRLHTAFTNLPRPIKNFLTIDGRKLVVLDIKNSQPLLFTWLANCNFWESKKTEQYKTTLKYIDPSLYKDISTKHKEPKSQVIKMLKSLESQADRGSQHVSFSKLVTSGELYEFIQKEFKGQYIEHNIDRFSTRSLTKAEVMRIFFFDTAKANRTFYKPFKQFAKLFPIESDIMKLIKSCGYTRFPILLQKLESYLMLEKIGESMPDSIPFLTVHDSLIFTDDDTNIDTVTKLIINRFQENICVAPQINNPESLYPERAFNQLDSYVEEKLLKMELQHGNGRDQSEFEEISF
jgi:hypothetical protein